MHVNVPTEAACSLLAGAIGFYWSRSHAPEEGTRTARRKANKKTGSSRKSEGPLSVSRLPASVRSLRAEQRHLPFRHRLRPRLSPPEEPGQLLQGRYGFSSIIYAAKARSERTASKWPAFVLWLTNFQNPTLLRSTLSTSSARSRSICCRTTAGSATFKGRSTQAAEPARMFPNVVGSPAATGDLPKWTFSVPSS